MKTRLQELSERLARGMTLVERSAERLWQAVKRIALYPIPEYTRSGFYWQAVFVLGAYLCLRCWPVFPGIAIGFVALASAIMAVRADHFTRAERAIWIAISLVLCIVEITAIYKDRKEYTTEQANLRREEDNARRKQDEAFAALITEGKSLIATQEQITKEMTGEGSYFYLGPSEPFPLQGTTLLSNALPEFVGRYPLHDLFAEVIGPWGFRRSINYGTMFPEELGRPREGPALTFKADDSRPIIFHVSINASNGSFYEQIRFQKIDGKWRRALTVSNFKTGKPVCTWMEIGFPNIKNEKLWPTKTTIRTDGTKRVC